MGGWVEIVDTTVTRTPRRCTASTSERVAVAGEQNHVVDRVGISMASTASSMSMLPLTLRVRSTNLVALVTTL